MKRKALVLIIFLITASLLSTPAAWADGASSTEELWVEWRYPTDLGNAIYTGGSLDLEGYTRLNKFNVSETVVDVDYDSLQIYYMQVRVTSDGADSRTVRFAAYNYTSNTNAGARYGYDEQTMAEGASAWRGGTLGTPIDVEDVGVFFYGIWAIAEDDIFYIRYKTGGGNQVYDDAWTDPLDEAGSSNDPISALFRVKGYKNTTTTHNQYYGSATDYIARRDINYTFPTGSDNRQMRITYLNTESISNITRSNGGAWDTALTSSDYSTSTLNGTHKLITIPHATLNSYGADYRVYTQSHDYVYVIEGAFYENGTSYGAINVTVIQEDQTTTLLVDGSTTEGYNESVTAFEWEIGSGITRRIFTIENTETFNIYLPEDDFSLYSFTIKDFTMRLGEGDAWLEALRVVNSTQDLITRELINNVINDVPEALVISRVYTMRILFDDGTTFSFGLLVTGGTTSITLPITGITFSQAIQSTYSYVTVEATRPATTQITINYNDSRAATNWRNITIAYRNGTKATSDNSTSNNSQFNWLSADENTSYRVTVDIDHDDFGDLKYDKYLDAEGSYSTFPSLAALGSMGNVVMGNLFGVTLVLIIMGAFSAVSAGLGMFLAVVTAGLLEAWGVTSFGYNVLMLCGVIVVAFAIIEGRRRQII